MAILIPPMVMSGIRDFLERDPFDEKAYKAYLLETKAENYVISYLLLRDNKIIRTRINDDCKRFNNVNNLKYPPAESARTDRASLEGKPMFYGSIFTHQADEIFLPRAISLMETSEFFRDVNASGYQLITQSVWRNNRDLRLAMLPVSELYKTPSDELMHMRREHKVYFPQMNVGNIDEATILGDMFASPQERNTYNLTAHFVDYLLNESSEGDYFDGVVYPSVPSEGLGMNICIRKELIDNGDVTCDGACTELLIKHKKQSKLAHLYDCNVTSDGTLDWRLADMLTMAVANPALFSDLLFL